MRFVVKKSEKPLKINGLTLYSSIGTKIQILAFVCAICGTIASFIYAILLISHEQSTLGVIYLICGPILSWVATLILYGFGTLVKNSEEINKKLDNKD